VAARKLSIAIVYLTTTAIPGFHSIVFMFPVRILIKACLPE